MYHHRSSQLWKKIQASSHLLEADRLVVGLEDKHAELDGAHDDDARLEEGVVVPRSEEEGRVAVVAGIEEGHLGGHAISNLGGVEDPQPGAVVGEVGQVVADVEVVVDGGDVGKVGS